MQVMTPDFTAEQLRADQKYYRHVDLFRRYWDSGTSTYKWETTAYDIDGYVSKVSTAKWKLDVGAFGEWKSPNFQVEADNRRNEWSEIEASGIWQDGGTFIPELSRVRVRTGNILGDGTEEDAFVFGGVISKPLAFHDEKKTASLNIVGLDELLRRVSAEDLSTEVTPGELLGSDSGTEFTTDNNGVGIFTEIRKGDTAGGWAGATALEPETDFTESDTNEKLLPGKITLTVALTAGKSVWATYKYWYQDKDLSWVVEQLLLLARISNYTVDSTAFSTDIENTATKTTKADFDACTLSNIDTVHVVDSFRRKFFNWDDFADGDFANNPMWTPGGYGDPSGWSVSSGILQAVSPAEYLQSILGRYYGTYDVKMYPTSGAVRFWFNVKHDLIYVPPPTYVGPYGCCLEVTATDTSLITRTPSGGDSTAWTYPRVPGSGDVYRVSLNSDWGADVYIDSGAGFVKFTSETISIGTPNSNYIRLALQATGSASFDNIVYSFSTLTTEASVLTDGVLTSDVIDAGVSLVSWGKCAYNVALAGGSMLVETYSSTSSNFSTGNDPAGWVAISALGQIQSAVNRYIKVRLTLTSSAVVGVIDTPEISDFSIKYYTTSTTLPLVDMTGKSCLTGIQDCASFPSYELGFKANDSFFYRARSTTVAPVLTLSIKTNLIKETAFNTGRDRIYNRVTANFGDFKAIVDCETEGETQPHSIDRDGVKEYPVSGSLLPKEGANIAGAAAATIYAYTIVPRKRATVEIKYLMHLELGDVVTYEREHKFGRWKWGDTDRAYGNIIDEDFVYYADPSTTGWDLNMRIEGIEFETDPKKWRMRLDLVENI